LLALTAREGLEGLVCRAVGTGHAAALLVETRLRYATRDG
jgi:L-asparaginase/Glu-tRNA(Gln) amidotransferase subunit D